MGGQGQTAYRSEHSVKLGRNLGVGRRRTRKTQNATFKRPKEAVEATVEAEIWIRGPANQ
jgi:hypothetical protein